MGARVGLGGRRPDPGLLVPDASRQEAKANSMPCQDAIAIATVLQLRQESRCLSDAACKIHKQMQAVTLTLTLTPLRCTCARDFARTFILFLPHQEQVPVETEMAATPESPDPGFTAQAEAHEAQGAQSRDEDDDSRESVSQKRTTFASLGRASSFVSAVSNVDSRFTLYQTLRSQGQHEEAERVKSMKLQHIDQELLDLLVKWDETGDGRFEMSEVIKIASYYKDKHTQVRVLQKRILALIFSLLLIFLGGVGGIFAVGFEYFFPIRASEDDPVLRQRDTGLPIRTASSDFELVDGMLLSRQSDADHSDNGPSPFDIVRVGVNVQRKKISSGCAFSEESLQSWTSVEITCMDQKAFFGVGSAKLLANVSWISTAGWLVRLELQNSGTIILDGGAAYFDEALVGHLEASRSYMLLYVVYWLYCSSESRSEVLGG